MNQVPHHPMDDDEVIDTLAAADAMPTGAPPVAAIVERGRRDRRRARTVALAGAAAAVVAVVGGVALVNSGSDPAIAPADQSGTTAEDGAAEDGAAEDGAAEDAGPVPAAPDGMRWIGKAGVMVAVPDAWPTSGDGAGSVELRQDRSRVPGKGDDFGDGIRRGQAECRSGGVCTTLVRVGDRGVSVYVEFEDAGLVDRVTATVQRVPDGATVVPARAIESLFIGAEGRAAYLRQLRRAGLEAEPAPGLDPNGTFDIEPEPGSVVPEGSVVRLVRPVD